jgi:hypothetical protein
MLKLRQLWISFLGEVIQGTRYRLNNYISESIKALADPQLYTASIHPFMPLGNWEGWMSA